MKLKISEGADPNYLATVVKVPEIRNHPNADRLSLVDVFGNTIIIAKGAYREGEKVVYFPVESALDTKFLSWANLLDKPELNADGKSKSFFESKGRVRAVSLRGIPSQGFLFKVSELAKFYNTDEEDFNIGDIFDIVGEHVLVKKYVKGTSKQTGTQNSPKSRVPRFVENCIGILPRSCRRIAYQVVNSWFNRNRNSIGSKIVNGQFSFHYKTEQFGQNMWLLTPDDEITISAKLHGTSAIYANVLCKKDFSFWCWFKNKFGADISTTEYKLIYSSRSIIKNRNDGKYTDDCWGEWAEKLDDVIEPGYSVYGEIVGYTGSGKMIQKGYDYGVFLNDCDFRVYRITITDPKGSIDELSWDMIEHYCDKWNLKTVPVYYKGVAKDMFPDIPVDDKWNENFLNRLKDEYLDKPCELCTTGVIREGIVIKINSREKKPVFKFKSPMFEVKSSSLRDEGYEDLEESS